MTAQDSKRLLVITGDHGIVRQIRQTFHNKGFSIQVAYSHLDGMYILENGEFDAVLMENGLVDRATGEPSFALLADVNPQVPFLVMSSNGIDLAIRDFPGVTFIPRDEAGIYRHMAILFHLPIPVEEPPLEGHPPQLSLGDDPRRAEEIRTLFELSRSLTEVLDLSEVLNRVVEAARRLTNAEEGMILLPEDGDDNQLYLRAKVGIDVEVARNFRVKTHDTVAGNVFHTGKSSIIGAQGPQKVKTEYLVNALLYVPIQYKGKRIGVLGVNNRSKDKVFEPRYEELLLNLASFAAIAIENARVHEETLARTRELQSLVEASEVVNASLSLERTLPNICEQLSRVVNVGQVIIYWWNMQDNHLQALAQHFYTIWPVGHGKRIPLRQWESLYAALAEDRPLVSEPANGDEAATFYLAQQGVQMVITVPISGGGQLLGAVQLFYVSQPETLPDTDTITRIRNMSLEGLVTLSNQQDAQIKERSTLRMGMELNRIAGSDWCELSTLASESHSLNISLAVGDSVWLGTASPELDASRYPDLLEALRNQTPLNMQADNKMMPPGARVLLDMTHSKALLGLPLVQRGGAVGLVVLADMRRGRPFSNREVDLGRAIVGQAATALENATLVRDLEASLIELKETQSRLVQTARLSAMGELAAVVAHQINNPLTTITVDSEMLLLDEPEDSPNYKALQAIARAGRRASSVARRLLAIARPTDNNAQDEPIDVAETIEGVLSLVKSHIERDNIQVIPTLLSESLPPVWAISGQLEDIWLNLLLNAHDAISGQQDAKIGIDLNRADENALEIIVWDNGPGIPPEILQEIFKPFFTTKPVGQGTGLGLHICREVVERIGGTIEVTSRVNEGTRFRVLLPVRKGGA
ncbi:MAG: GAF domain-containing protein [Anaerolineaceae bacterium]|nr:GAF domain-containing protein [Anaerolineaceae bacterium]